MGIEWRVKHSSLLYVQRRSQGISHVGGNDRCLRCINLGLTRDARENHQRIELSLVTERNIRIQSIAHKQGTLGVKRVSVPGIRISSSFS